MPNAMPTSQSTAANTGETEHHSYEAPRDYYELLGVPRDASPEMIKRTTRLIFMKSCCNTSSRFQKLPLVQKLTQKLYFQTNTRINHQHESWISQAHQERIHRHSLWFPCSGNL